VPVTFTGTRDIPITDLTRFPGNARRGNVAEIRKSIRRHGQYRAIVVRDCPDGLVILAGNHTRDALEAEGHESARCEVITCTDDEARRVNLADNRLSDMAVDDSDALAELLSYLDGDYDGTGWTEEDVDALITPPEDFPGGSGDPDGAPDAPADPVSKPGDVYVLGPHKLLVGDATDMAAVEAMMDGDRADCMWTDPPYGVEYVGKTKNELTIRNDGVDGLAGLLAGAFAVATAALKPGAAIYVAHPANASLPAIFADAFTQAGWLLRQNLIWHKDVMVLGHTDYHYRHEPILFGYTDGAQGRLGRSGGSGWYGDHSQTSVFEVPKPSRSESHPTMKPVALVAAMLGNSCPKRGIVYDPFGGSGSTLIAAHQLGQKARLVELDARYADVIIRRWIDFAGIKPERVLPDGTTEPVSFT
jgi:DNA modification methylase